MFIFMLLRYAACGTILLLFLACGSEPADTEFQATPTDGRISNADLIRNPVGAEGTFDTLNVARFAFAETRYAFGEVEAGAVVEKTFSFTNTGRVPLVITDARSTCGCTVADYPETPIAPGQGGEITVEFDTKNKSGEQFKPVTLTANTYPSTTKLMLVGRVVE